MRYFWLHYLASGVFGVEEISLEKANELYAACQRELCSGSITLVEDLDRGAVIFLSGLDDKNLEQLAVI